MPPRRRPCPLRWRATDMRRLVLLAVFALIALTAACAVGPGYRRSSLDMPDGWRPRAASEDSLRRFYDSLRTSRDTLLPAGADTARLPFSYDTTLQAPRVDSTAGLRWLDLIQDSVLRQLVDTSLRANRDMRTALAVIDEFRARNSSITARAVRMSRLARRLVSTSCRSTESWIRSTQRSAAPESPPVRMDAVS